MITGLYEEIRPTLSSGQRRELAIGEDGVLLTQNVQESDGGGLFQSLSFNRPSDTTPYTINDRIGPTTDNTGVTPIQGVELTRADGRPSLLVRCRIAIQKVDFLPTLRVHFYNSGAPSGTALVGDNAAFVRTFNNLPNRIGSITLPTLTAESDHAVAMTSELSFVLYPASGSRLIYPVLQIVAGTSITPSSAMPVRVDFWTVEI